MIHQSLFIVLLVVLLCQLHLALGTLLSYCACCTWHSIVLLCLLHLAFYCLIVLIHLGSLLSYCAIVYVLIYDSSISFYCFACCSIVPIALGTWHSIVLLCLLHLAFYCLIVLT